MQLADKIVYVGPFLKRAERGDGGKEERFTNVYIKNLADEVDDDGLNKMCSEYGPVTSAVVMTVSGAPALCALRLAAGACGCGLAACMVPI